MKSPRWTGPACPKDPVHGALLDWPGATTAWFCPHRGHVGRGFYNSDLEEVAQPEQTVSPLRQRASGPGSHASPPHPSDDPPSRMVALWSPDQSPEATP